MLPLRKEEIKSHQDTISCYIRGKRTLKKLAESKKYWKLRDHCHFTGKYRSATHSVYNLKFNVPNDIPAVFQSGSNHDYHFILKELASKFEGQFECLEENTEKHKAFSFPIEKEVTKLIKMVMQVLNCILQVKIYW